MSSILLIDDSTDLLQELADALRAQVTEEDAEIRTWSPSKEDADSKSKFEELIDSDTILVVTDSDLTTGKTGLFGSSIVAWCQARAIPVGNYTRNHEDKLPKEPNLFELRVPTDPNDGAAYIAKIFRGFLRIKNELNAKQELGLRKKSPSAVLSGLLGAPELESQISLYGVRLSITNTALVERMMHSEGEPPSINKIELLSYITGHLLLNSILRFPGPIISKRALAAYIACSEDEIDHITHLFPSTTYSGPFSELDEFYWLHLIDDALEVMIDCLPGENATDTIGQLNREAVENELGRTLSRHGCVRCEGVNGGYICPFTNKTVCHTEDCSVGSSSLLPQGARLCRIERDFYDEWAPIVGI